MIDILPEALDILRETLNGFPEYANLSREAFIRTDLSGVEDLRTLATETLLDELSMMGYDYLESMSTKDVLVFRDSTHEFFTKQ